jgi:hypothetical protein
VGFRTLQIPACYNFHFLTVVGTSSDSNLFGSLKGIAMAIVETPALVTAPPVKRRIRLDTYVLIIGGAAVALYAVARLLFEPSMHDKEAAMRAAMAAEHVKVCDQLGKAGGSDRDSCLAVLDSLYSVHQQAILADNSEI